MNNLRVVIFEALEVLLYSAVGLTCLFAFIYALELKNKNDKELSNGCRPRPSLDITPLLTHTKKSAPVTKFASYADFLKAHFLIYLENECPPKGSCCNTLKGDKWGYTCFGIASNKNKEYAKIVKKLMCQLKKSGIKKITPKMQTLIRKKSASVYVYQKYYINAKMNLLPCLLYTSPSPRD